MLSQFIPKKKSYKAVKIWFSPFLGSEVRAQGDEMTTPVPKPLSQEMSELTLNLWLDF